MFPPYPVISVLPPLPSGVTIAVAENHQTKSGALGPWGLAGGSTLVNRNQDIAAMPMYSLVVTCQWVSDDIPFL
jgi:hypothetical protein